MSLEQILGIIGQIATWITVFFVYLTLREMEKQRRTSQKPELIIPNISINGYAQNFDKLFIASQWGNDKIKDDNRGTNRFPQFTIYNIGTGAAKEISIKWKFDFSQTLKTIQDYCYQNSIPVVVTIHNNLLEVNFKGHDSGTNIEAFENDEASYIMPASITSQGLKSQLPAHYLVLISILIFLKIHYGNNLIDGKPAIPFLENLFEVPPLFLEIHYADISGNKYKKEFDVQFNIYGITKFKDEIERVSLEEVYIGAFEFKERN